MLPGFHLSHKWYNVQTERVMNEKYEEKPRFHQRSIPRGKYGELSKIVEEVEEALDSEEQGHRLMLLIELSDIVGAVEGVLIKKKFNHTVEDLIKFARLRGAVSVANGWNSD
jgi:hypothetical protein